MLKKIIISNIIIVVLLTGCGKKTETGTMSCKVEEESKYSIDYIVDYEEDIVKNVDITYKNCEEKLTGKSNSEILNEINKEYCSHSYDGFECSVSISGNCKIVKTIYDYKKLSDKELAKLETTNWKLDNRNINKVEENIGNKNTNLKCENNKVTK